MKLRCTEAARPQQKTMPPRCHLKTAWPSPASVTKQSQRPMPRKQTTGSEPLRLKTSTTQQKTRWIIHWSSRAETWSLGRHLLAGRTTLLMKIAPRIKTAVLSPVWMKTLYWCRTLSHLRLCRAPSHLELWRAPSRAPTKKKLLPAASAQTHSVRKVRRQRQSNKASGAAMPRQTYQNSFSLHKPNPPRWRAARGSQGQAAPAARRTCPACP